MIEKQNCQERTQVTSQNRLGTSQRRAGTAWILIGLAVICVLSFGISLSMGSNKMSVDEIIRALFIEDDSVARLLVWNLRLPRVLTGALVGICLSLSGCVLQGVMRNNLASPSTIGVTSGATFAAYLTLVAQPAWASYLPAASFAGALATTLLIYLLSYRKGDNTSQLILSGLAVSALFGAFNSLIQTYFAEDLGNVAGFLVGGLNGVVWKHFFMILPYALLGIVLTIFTPAKMNILLLGEETAKSLGLETDRFRFLVIIISSLLAGAAISVVGSISFVGLIVPHIARILVGSDYRYLFPASAFLGAGLLMICDSLGRVIMPPGEVPVGIIMACLGAPFFLFLLRKNARRL